MSEVSVRGQQRAAGSGAGEYPGSAVTAAHLLPTQAAGQRGGRESSETANQAHPAGHTLSHDPIRTSAPELTSLFAVVYCEFLDFQITSKPLV